MTKRTSKRLRGIPAEHPDPGVIYAVSLKSSASFIPEVPPPKRGVKRKAEQLVPITNLMFIRASHASPSTKTSAKINLAQVQMDASVDEAVLQSAIRAKFKTIPGYRDSEITEYSLTGSPLKVMTPGKTELTLTSKNGLFYIFSSKASKVPGAIVHEIDQPEKFFKSEKYLGTIRPTADKKFQEVLITEEIYQHKQKRSSQNAVMQDKSADIKFSGSATEYAKATECFDGFWEWLHLVAFHMVGQAGQKENNLVAGTNHANTDMMFVEALVKYFSKYYPAGVLLTVETELIPDTQIAKEIKYKIETPDFKLGFVFNAQSTLKPSMVNHKYMSHYATTILNMADHKTKPAAKPKSFGPLFFDKSALATVPTPASPIETKANDALQKVFNDITNGQNRRR